MTSYQRYGTGVGIALAGFLMMTFLSGQLVPPVPPIGGGNISNGGASLTNAPCGTNSLITATGANSIGCVSSTDDGTTFTNQQALSQAGSVAFTGVQTTSATGTQNNFTINAGTLVLRASPASATTYSGFTGGTEGRMLIVEVTGAGVVTLTNLDAGSTSANQLLVNGGSGATLVGGTTNSTAFLLYDATASHWRMIAQNSTTIAGAITIGNTLTANGISTTGGLTASGASHIKSTGNAVSFSTCGTSPACNSTTCNDISGTFTTGSAATTCTITFGATYTGADDATCLMMPMGTATMPVYTVSATAITMSTSIASTKYKYICVGH